MKYLIFSTIGNENFGDESMATNYVNKNIGWENCDLITYYEQNAKKVRAANVFNPFGIFKYKNKFQKVNFMMKVLINSDSLLNNIELPRKVEEYEAFIMSGGGNLKGNYIDTIIYMYLITKLFKGYNKKIFYRPQSIGPFNGIKGILGKILLRRILNMSDEFLVRETESHKLAKLLLNDSKIKLQIDDAWTLDIEEINNNEISNILNKETKKIAISARPWNLRESYLEKLTEVVNRALDKKYEVFFVPIAFGGDTTYIDNAFIKEELKKIKGVYFIEDYLEMDKTKAENIKWILSKMDRCIGLSYHFNVFSKSLNKKTIALYSDQYYYIKNYGLYSLLQDEDNVVEIEQLSLEKIEQFLN